MRGDAHASSPQCRQHQQELQGWRFVKVAAERDLLILLIACAGSSRTDTRRLQTAGRSLGGIADEIPTVMLVCATMRGMREMKSLCTTMAMECQSTLSWYASHLLCA